MTVLPVDAAFFSPKTRIAMVCCSRGKPVNVTGTCHSCPVVTVVHESEPVVPGLILNRETYSLLFHFYGRAVPHMLQKRLAAGLTVPQRGQLQSAGVLTSGKFAGGA